MVGINERFDLPASEEIVEACHSNANIQKEGTWKEND